MTRYYEDIMVGEPVTLGEVSVTEEEIIEFGKRYDPQPFHVDPDAAAQSPFGGVVASGWQTAALCMRVLVDEYLQETAAMGALGLDELRWETPLRPGDTLTVRSEILEKRVSETDPGRGVVRSELTAENQSGAEVIRWIAVVLVARREQGDRSSD